MISKANIVAIVPAAGYGARMNSQLPKQYLTIGTQTIIEHTINKLISCHHICRVVVAISPQDTFFSTLAVAKDKRVSTVFGGDSRAASVFAGLEQLADNEWAMVHDAARPCITHEDINKLINAVFEHGKGGILAVPIVDTVKLESTSHHNTIEKTLDRTYLWGAVTPQLFQAKELKACLSKALSDNAVITDEASAIEYCGGKPLLVSGRRDNLKVTRPEDLALAKFYLTEQLSINLTQDKETICA